MHYLLSQAFPVVLRSKYENRQELRVLSRKFSLFLLIILHCLLSATQIRIILQKIREGLFKTICNRILTSLPKDRANNAIEKMETKNGFVKDRVNESNGNVLAQILSRKEELLKGPKSIQHREHKE